MFRDLSSRNTRLSCVEEQGLGQCIFRDGFKAEYFGLRASGAQLLRFSEAPKP